MAETTPPLYMNIDNFFDAAALALPWRDVFGAGVVGADDMLVSAGTGMQVSVATGVAWIPGTDNVLAQGCYRCTNNGAKNLTIAAADPTNPRVETVIAHVYDSEFAGTQLKWALEVLTGTATSGATIVNLTGKAPLPTTGYSYVLSYVLVPAGADSSALFTFSDQRVAARNPRIGLISHTAFSSTATINTTTEGTAVTVVTAPAHTFDGVTPLKVEFFSPSVGPGPAAGAIVTVVLFEDGSPIGHVAAVESQAASQLGMPVRASHRFIPTAGSHTYSIRAYESGGAGVINGGAGGAGVLTPGYLRLENDA